MGAMKGRTSYRWATAAVLAAALLCSRAWCDQPQQFTEDVNDAGKDTVAAARTRVAPKIDGVLDDECWKDATRLTTFRVGNQPGQGLLPEQQTEVLVTSDKQALYFGFICYESDVTKIAAHQTQYDGSFDLDDCIDIGLDTFCDKTRSYVFVVNPLGTRNDSRWGDSRWNAKWQAAAKIGKDCWTVEMAIPFSILTMPKNAKKFGFNCGRFVQRRSEWDDWKYTKNYSWREFTWAQLTGFEIGAAMRPDRYLGYVVGSRRFEEPASTTGHIGGDWEHPLTSTSTAMLTINPDWSQIEAAHASIDFTYVERSLPEVRPFFVESLPYLPTNTIFYPQGRIYRFDEGLKVTGTDGPFRFGVLGMLGVQRFADVPREDDLAARLWYDFSHETYLNVSDVRSGTDNSSHVEFVQEHKGPINTRTVAAYYHQSSDLPGLGGSQASLRTYAQTEDWSLKFSWENTGDNIRPALGRLPRPGIHRVGCEASRYFNPKRGTAWFEQASVEASYDRALDHQGNLNFESSSASFDVRQSPRLSFGGGPALYRHPGPTGKPFDDLTWGLWASFFERQPTSASLSITVGNIEESGYRNFSVRGQARTPGDRLAASANLEWTRWGRRNELSLHGSEENAHQYTVGLSYRLSRRTTFALSQRWLKQAAQSRSIFSAVFRKQYGVDHDLFVIYGDPQNPDETVNQIMVKYVMPFGKWGER
jgi:hypothetical protein